MEMIVGIVLALSLLGNWWQSERIDHHKAKAETFQQAAQDNYHELKKAVTANDTLVDTIERLESANADCSAKHRATLDRINDFKESNRLKDSAIENLKLQLDKAPDQPINDWDD